MTMVDRIALDRKGRAPVEALLVDALLVEALPVEALPVEALPVEAVLVEALPVEVHDDAPVTGGSALAQPKPRPIELTPEPDARPDLRVAPDGYRRRRRVRIAAASAAVALSVTLFAVVGFNVVLAQHQIELQTLQRKLQSEETRYYELRNEVAQASSPARIVAKATALGLIESPETQLPADIKPPELGPTQTAEKLRETSKATGGSRDHPRP